ncbi:hypothetical protein [Flavobacterium branchiicola]|uniref:Uncharacterized protein n=1 Tax=Flavobacterium branchiicola TaxID=1114875 RepID=A0ABV9PAQ7_9FLAO|nr:hypothetical protein [Flavobacterium branchiicola]MBS7253670.1 hypothetical protein [Flavobacterium branchiicola]
MKFIHILFTAFCTMLAYIIGLFFFMPNNMGYGGLFLLLITPIVFGIAFAWSPILNIIVSSTKIFKNIIVYIALTIILEYITIAFAMLTLSADKQGGYNLIDFKNDVLEIFLDNTVFAFTALIAVTFGVCFLIGKQN